MNRREKDWDFYFTYLFSVKRQEEEKEEEKEKEKSWIRGKAVIVLCSFFHSYFWNRLW